jgi:hypothetical protein
MKFILLLTLFFLQTNIAYAYIDPFTGAFILQALSALFATIILYLGYPFRLIKKIYLKFFPDKKDKKDNDDKP